MTVFYVARRDGDGESAAGPRVGFTVGKVLGGAVVRNRIKRRLREAVRLHGPVAAAVDVVINPKKSMLTTPFEELRNEVGRAFEVIDSQRQEVGGKALVQKTPRSRTAGTKVK